MERVLFFRVPADATGIWAAARGKGEIKNKEVLSQLNALYHPGNQRTKGIYNHLMLQRSPESMII